VKRELRIPRPLTIEVDPDVKAVLEFMHGNFEATKLIDIANAVKELSGPFFGHFKTELNPHVKRFIPIALRLSSSDGTDGE
jgi:hypothetical protein